MRKGWLLTSIVMGLFGAGAGVAVFFAAALVTEGLFIPVAAGFGALLLSDLVLFVMIYPGLFQEGVKK